MQVTEGNSRKLNSTGDLPFNWVNSDGPGLVQTLGNDYIAEGAIQPGHLDHVKALVSPVNISYKRTEMLISYVVMDKGLKIAFQIRHDETCDPVDCDALHPANAVGDHIFSPCLIPLRPADGAQAHVHPVDGVIL